MVPSSSSGNNLVARSASGIALGLAVLGGIYLGNPYWFALLFFHLHGFPC